MMKQVFLEKGKVYRHEVNVPHMGEHDLLVSVHHSFISSGTEYATLSDSRTPLVQKFVTNIAQNSSKILGALKENGLTGTAALIKGKMHQVMPLGYSCSGQVLAVGHKVKNVNNGDFVACAGAGMANHADIVSVPENLVVKVRNKNYLKQASLTTIGSIAMQGIRRAQLNLGETVCIIGLGLIGQITVQLAKQAGCKVFGIDLQESRLELAHTLGADYVFNPHTPDFIKSIEFATSHYGADATIVTAASASGLLIEQAMHITRRKGKVVLVGDVKLDFNREPFYSKEIDLLISCSYGPGRYDHTYEKEGHDYPYAYVRWTENRNMECFLNLIEEGKIFIDPLISQECTIENVQEAYSSLENHTALGIVLSYDPKIGVPQQYKDTLSLSATPYRAPDGTMHVGVVGVGGFCKIKLLPIIAQCKNIKIHSIIDVEPAQTLSISKQYEAPHTSNDYRKLFDENVHAVVIATPHALHTEQSIECMKRGKAVFVEKPAAVTFDQLTQLKHYIVANPKSFYCVDFNRSYSPFMTSLKKIVTQRTNPLLIHYRMNAGFLPANHWIQSEKHRGRIIGEACHIFELFCFLTDAKPRSVAVAPVTPRANDMALTDNFIAQVTMDDGSCCSLTYTSLGNGAMNKEYMELFCDGKSVVMNDYLEMKGYGLPVSFNKRAPSADKGHEQLLSLFFQAAQSDTGVSPIPFERIMQATELTLIVDKLARAGGGFEEIA